MVAAPDDPEASNFLTCDPLHLRDCNIQSYHFVNRRQTIIPATEAASIPQWRRATEGSLRESVTLRFRPPSCPPQPGGVRARQKSRPSREGRNDRRPSIHGSFGASGLMQLIATSILRLATAVQWR